MTIAERGADRQTDTIAISVSHLSVLIKNTGSNISTPLLQEGQAFMQQQPPSGPLT